MKLTKDQIKEIIDQQYEIMKNDDQGWVEDYEHDDIYSDGGLVEECLIPWESSSAYSQSLFKGLAASYGGEGMGDDYWIVVEVQHPVYGEVFLKWAGYYSSWSGVEWTGEPFQVFPAQVTRTEYLPQEQ